MNFYCHFAQFERRCNLLIWASCDNQSEHFSLARRQSSIAYTQIRRNPIVEAPFAITFDSRLNCLQQLLLAQRLGQEFDRAGFYRLPPHRDITVPADEYDRNQNLGCLQFALELQSTLPWQPDVKNNAAKCIEALALKKFPGRLE